MVVVVGTVWVYVSAKPQAPRTLPPEDDLGAPPCGELDSLWHSGVCACLPSKRDVADLPEQPCGKRPLWVANESGLS